jgi:hypothetical protein
MRSPGWVDLVALWMNTYWQTEIAFNAGAMAILRITPT